MNKIKSYLFCILSGSVLMTSSYAQSTNSNAYALMTARDVQNNTSSNLTITNQTTQSITATGLFIASFDTNSGLDNCSACFGSVVSGDNAGGAVVAPITFRPNQALTIGQNYLYNMIYNGIYYIKNTVGSSPCQLPGCSWPGDDANTNGWCITINATSLDSSYTFSHYQNGSNPPANILAYAQAGNSIPFDYKYDLINPTTLGSGGACFGPIICNDKTLTCRVSTAQNEAFQAY